MSKLFNPSSQAAINDFEPGDGKKYSLPCKKITEIPDDLVSIFLETFQFLIDVDTMSKEEAETIEKEMTEKEKLILKCKICGFTTTNKRALMHHEKTHKDEKSRKETKKAIKSKKVEDLTTGELM